jgi:hypothetical protein
MNVKKYLDSTYLKTAGREDFDGQCQNSYFIQEAIDEDFKLMR